jgi:hypothetical protein
MFQNIGFQGSHWSESNPVKLTFSQHHTQVAFSVDPSGNRGALPPAAGVVVLIKRVTGVLKNSGWFSAVSFR